MSDYFKSNPVAVSISHCYRGRALQGWSYVDFETCWDTDTKVSDWIKNNVEGSCVKDFCGRSRWYFELESDALMCYLAHC